MIENPITVIVPTYNAGSEFNKFCKMLKRQTGNIKKVIIIDSSSKDNTAHIAREHGFFVISIDQKDFGHGKTRQMAVELAKTEIVCFLTQDALPTESSSIEKLSCFLTKDNALGAVYGRQLPYPYTGALGSFARLYNYPDSSFINCFEDRKQRGFKTIFLSDTFAAYKKSILLKIGGFPLNINFGEDSYVAAKMLLAGYKTGYCADATVYHAHDYSFKQEWDRAKEIKRFHKTEDWLLRIFGKPEGEGVKFVLAQIQYLMKQGLWASIPIAVFQDLVKFIGYKVG